MQLPTIELTGGLRAPVLSVGTYKVENLEEVIDAAFAKGLLAVDAAEHYHNEVAVGTALKHSGWGRDAYYLSTKIWNADQGYEKTLRAFEGSVERLQTEPDMLLMHWPCPMLGLYQETWQAMQTLLKSGRVRGIGVCNFKIAHLEELKKLGGVQPMVNQIEMHPFFIDDEMLAYAKENHIVIEAWSPLLRGTKVISDPMVVSIAQKYGVSPAQLAIRYLTQYGVRVIVKSSNPLHVTENCDVFDFRISDEDFERLRTLNVGKRVFQDPDAYCL